MDFSNNPENLQTVKKASEAFRMLNQAYDELNSKVIQAGYKQRNALIDNVHSNYTHDDKAIEAKVKWEKLVFQLNVHKGLIDLIRPHIDLHGYFPDYRRMISEFDALFQLSIRNEDFEVASILKRWRDEFPNP